MLHPRCYFTESPPEVLSLIVRQAHLQDAAYQQEKGDEKRLGGLSQPFREIQLKGWRSGYGHSVMALHSTCKTLKAAAAPYVFKVLPLSKSLSNSFHVFIKVQYAASFTTLRWDSLKQLTTSTLEDADVDPEDHDTLQERSSLRGQQMIKKFVSSTLPLLRNIQTIEFPNPFTANCFLESLPPLSLADWSEFDTPEDAILKQATRNLALSVNSIFFRSNSTWDEPLWERFTNLTRVALEGPSYVPDFFNTLEIPAIVGLTSLSAHFPYRTLHANSSLDMSWPTIPWQAQNNLRNLDLDLPVIFTNEWQFIRKFLSTLSSLSLKFDLWNVDIDMSQDLFPSLRTITLNCEIHNSLNILQRLSPSTPLSKLKLILRKGEDLQVYTTLLPILRQLNNDRLSLEVNQLTGEVAADVRNGFNDFARAANLGGGASLTGLSGWHSWASPAVRTPYHPSRASDALLLLDYVKDRVEGAERVGDTVGVEEWIRWLEPIAGRTRLDWH